MTVRTQTFFVRHDEDTYGRKIPIFRQVTRYLSKQERLAEEAVKKALRETIKPLVKEFSLNPFVKKVA